MLSRLILSFLIFLNQTTILLAEENKPHCYSDKELIKLSKAITLYKQCRVELAEKDILINTKLKKYDAAPAFWQEPSFVVGGIVVSAAVGAGVTWYLLRDKK
jgi:hypothetical protein